MVTYGVEANASKKLHRLMQETKCSDDVEGLWCGEVCALRDSKCSDKIEV